jgi:hypothetical protein
MGMAGKVAHRRKKEDANTIIQHLHKLVTYGPWDLDIAHAMAGYGYDEVKWAEGQVALAELVGGDWPAENRLAAASKWYEEAAAAAACALVASPKLLDKLGVAGARLE